MTLIDNFPNVKKHYRYNLYIKLIFIYITFENKVKFENIYDFGK